MKRLVLEMGVGADLEGADTTKAACRAVEDALRHLYMPLFRARDLDESLMAIEVTVAAQRPEAVDPASVAALFPYGTVRVVPVHGGLDIDHPQTGTRSVIVDVAIDVRHPMA